MGKGAFCTSITIQYNTIRRLTSMFSKIFALSIVLAVAYFCLVWSSGNGYMPSNIGPSTRNQEPHIAAVTVRPSGPPPRSRAKAVIIVAYFRSGSTLTGSLLQQNTGTFYLFEPIRSVRLAFAGKNNITTLHYLSGPRQYEQSQSDAVVIDELQAWTTCNFTALSIESLTDIFHKQFTTIMKAFVSCAGVRYSGQKTVLESVLNDTTRLESCLDLVMRICQKSTSIVIKLIRLRIGLLENVLPYYPNMKVIHLVRDPRGTLNSQSTLGYEKEVAARTNTLCADYEKNLNSTETMSTRFPKRIAILRYDDLAEHPVQTAKNIYQYVGYTFDWATEKFLAESTSASKDTGPHDVTRKNSSDTANKWRGRISIERAQFIYDTCKWSLQRLGYLPFDNLNDLRNTSKESKTVPNVTMCIA